MWNYEYFDYIEKMQKNSISLYKSVIKSKNTKQVYLEDFPILHKYIAQNFKNINFKNVQIYETSKKNFEKVGLGHASGFFVQAINCIFLLNNLDIVNIKFKNKLEKLLFENKFSLNKEDVLYHELMHYVSSSVRGNGGFKYKNNEEEFAYSSSIKFYLSNNKSMIEIKDSMLPFCVSAVLKNKKNVIEICKACEIDIKQIFHNKHAEKVFKIISDKANRYLNNIIDNYNKNGPIDLDLEPIACVYDDDESRFAFLG